MAVFKKLVRSAEGAKVPHMKNTENCETVKMPVPARVRIPMAQHIGAPAAVVVKKGDEVKVGTLIGQAQGNISANIYSSVSGKVFAIEETLFNNGAKSQTVVIDTDSLQTVAETVCPKEVTDFDSFISAVQESGLVGLGGAGFPTHFKLKTSTSADTLVINAAECEPYITADYREMMENAEDVVAGIELVKKYLDIKTVVIGIEGNKPKAIELLGKLTSSIEGVSVKTLPSVYPQGAEKVLIEQTTGKEVPQGKLPIEVGVLVMNVTTISFISKYIKTGMPLISKRVTVDGDAITTAQNVEVLLGTSVADLVEFCGGYAQEPGKIIYGGPMMGTALSDDTMPVIKQNNAILALGKEKAFKPEMSPCIRCGRCINACPMGLSPVEAALALSIKDSDSLQELKIDLCMNCGSCSFVCPAKRPVAQTMVEAKDFLRKAAQ